VSGPDGSLWFTDVGRTSAIGRITPAGKITEFHLGLRAGSTPGDIVSGPDGNLWFTDVGRTSAIGRITPAGKITEFTKGLNAGSRLGEHIGNRPGEFVSGVATLTLADGKVWFVDQGSTKAIGQITPSGTITEFSAGIDQGGTPTDITADPNGNLWFTAVGANKAIGRVSRSGAVTEFRANDGWRGNALSRIASGPSGSLWFTEAGLSENIALGRVTTNGLFSPVTLENPAEVVSSIFGITSSRDGNLWFSYLGQGRAAGIGRVTSTGVLTTLRKGLNVGSLPTAVAAGPGDTVWFLDRGRTVAIGRIGRQGLRPGSCGR